MTVWRAVAAAALTICFAAIVLADVPTTMSVQGRLTNDVGDPLPGEYFFIFKIFDSEISGDERWPGKEGEEAQRMTVDDDGLWNAAIGGVMPIPTEVFADTSLWLEITVDDRGRLTTLPRVKFHTGPFTFRAAWSQKADLATGLSANTVGSSQIIDGSIALADVGQNGAVKGDVMVWDGSQWTVDQSTTGDITGVSAGTGLTGGGASGNVTLNVGSGAGITVGADNVALDPSYTDALYVNEPGDTITGILTFDHLNDGQYEARIDPQDIELRLYAGGVRTAELGGDGEGSLGLFNASGNFRSRLFGSVWGELNLYDSDGDVTASLDASSSAGGSLYLDQEDGTDGMVLKGGSTSDGATLSMRSASGIEYIKFDADAPGDGRVFLSENAISAFEILDEPGIASNYSLAWVTLPLSAMVDIDTVTITIPTAGYIVVDGKTSIFLTGTTGSNYVRVQIDETAGGGTNDHAVYLGSNSSFSDAYGIYIPVSVNRVYYKAAGTYQFRLEGSMYGLNGSGAEASSESHSIVAQFFPTSYGDVLTAVSAEAAGEFESAAPETVTRTNPDGTTTTETVYRVNLRELELKATRARLAAEQAERELLEAQMLQLREDQAENEK